MNFLKKYIALIMPAVIGLVAILLFVPTILTSGTIKEKISQSQNMNDDIDRLIRNAVPSNQWAIEERYQIQHKNDVNNIEQLAVQTSQRKLISYDIFPEPKVASNQIFKIFGEKYTKAIDQLANDIMNAGDAPSQTTLGNLTSNSNVGSRRSRTASRGGKTNDTNQKIIDTACCEKAKGISVYTNPEDTFVGYNFWKDYEFISKDQGIEDCWYGQAAYWIQEDIAQTIAAINQGSNSVFTSKVKRLLGVRFETSDGDSKINEATTERPSYILEEETTGLAPVWTKRTCNDMIDVIHFSVAVIIDVSAEPEFYKYLCGQKEHQFKGWDGKQEEKNFKRNQITVLEHSLEPIDAEDTDHKHYRYGTTSVAKLNLVCEYFFNRKGYDEVKPKTIKEALGQAEEEEEPDDRKSRRKSRSKRKKSRD